VRVLIVDDSVVMRKIVESAVRRAGFDLDEVLHAENGARALALLEQARSIDLILCDVHMPVMDGPAFLLEASRRGLASRTPIIMVTADAGDPHLLKALAAGSVGYIEKPFTVEGIVAGISSHVAPAVRAPIPAGPFHLNGGAP